MNDCVFCDIAAGRVEALMVYEDDDLVVFPDLGQIRRGHLQIVPRVHVETFELLRPALAAHVVEIGQRLARAAKALYRVDRVAFLFTGGDIPHVHAHLVPMQEMTDITSRRYIAEEALTFRALPSTPLEERAAIARELREALDQLPREREDRS